MKGLIYFEDGTIFVGESLGAQGTVTGELVFNTSMTGYQEILTDPSYIGQIVTMTYPLIGNYGVEPFVNQSNSVKASGMIVKSAPENDVFSSYLIENKVVAVSNVDTRALTRKIREKGAAPCVITTEDLSVSELKKHLEERMDNRDAMKTAGTKQRISLENTGKKIAVLDFGIKENILNCLKERNCSLEVFPYSASHEDILSCNPDGIFLSNGPGDPEMAVEAIETIKNLLGKKPIFGICMGHQLLAKALGAKTYKMHYGHRGGNHGVLDLKKNRAFITSQNHGYAVEISDDLLHNIEITHINLNDGSIEGIKHKELSAFSVQYHPEGAPGPNDSTYLFDEFLNLCIVGGTSCL